MGYLDNSSITVDAVLTKKGREILKNGGNLNITSFTLSDTGVDYTLWNPDHPSGSAFYGEAIENLPMLEASVHAEYNLRNRLFTFPQNVIAMPTLVINGLDAGDTTLTVADADSNPAQLSIDIVGFNGGRNLGYNLVILDPNVVDLFRQNDGTTSAANTGVNISGTSQAFLSEQDIPFAREYSLSTNSFALDFPALEVIGKQTTVYVVDVETGAYNSFTAINNREAILRSVNRNPIG